MDTGTGIASTSDTMEQSDRELMSGNARRRDEEGRFSSDQNDRLSITGNQYEQLHEDMKQELSNREVDVRNQPTESEVVANEGYTIPTPRIEEINPGDSGNQGGSGDAGTARDLHQEALDRNAAANDGFKVPRAYDGKMAAAFEERERKENHDDRKEYFGEYNTNEKVSSLGEYMTPTARAAYEISLTGHVDNVDDVFSAMREKIERANDNDKTTVRSSRPVPAPEEADILEDIDSRLKEITDKLDDNAKQLANIELTSDLSNSELISLISKQNQLFSTQTALMNERFSIILEKQNVQIRVYIDNMLNNIQPTPVPEPTPAAPEFITVPPIPSADPDGQELKGEDTWEQISADYTRQIAELDQIMNQRPLTNEERIRYFNLDREKKYIDQNVIAPEQQESKRKREKKERNIRWVAGATGFGIALATPPVAVAAVVAVTLGGRFAGKNLKNWSEKLRSKSNAMKFEDRRNKTREQLDQMDKQQKRKAWWADRLGETSAVLLGGSAGYGIGSALQNVFGWKGIGGNAAEATTTSTTPEVTSTTTTPTPQADVGAGGGVMPTETATTSIGEGLGQSEWLDVSQYGWDSQKLGWLGNRLAVGPQGGAEGLLQKDFFGELTKLVPKEGLMGQESGNIVNQFLRNAYNGVNPTQVARSAAQALGY